jgi:hypothetical protein
MTAGPAGDQDVEFLSLKSRAQAKILARQRDAEARFAADPWVFLTEAVWTLDQVTGEVRQFPAHAYLESLTREWQRSKLLAVPKSRRMLVTWLFVSLHYWLIRFRPNTTVAFVSRKEGRNEAEGSAELVRRVKFIHDHLPVEVRKLEDDYKFCRFKLPAMDSEIIGMGQGPDQLRQLTLTAVFGDETAFWEWAKDAYIAMKPTVEGGGRVTLVSSANPGFFKQLCYDEV